ncbi:MAG: hypothetical protein CM1200mP10_24310 [Candidatus Neomarinimicrobiota bacterium]|nr:MAG: hypothetical protein CM1200mP10_24310 [Candidatus Neomarinimicrobiota bacterium]
MIITGNLKDRILRYTDSLNPVHLANLEIPFGNQNRGPFRTLLLQFLIPFFIYLPGNEVLQS